MFNSNPFLKQVLLEPMANALLFFYHLLFSDLGLAIIGLTIFIRLLLTPVTMPSLKAMQAMRELSPELSRLKAKHKGDKTKLMQAQADLYKSKGINPAAGCLPQLVQFAVLFVLLQVFYTAFSSNGNITDNINSLAYPIFKVTGNVNTQFLYRDLTKPDVFSIPNLPFPLPGPFLLAAALLQFLSSKMMSPIVEKEKELAEKTEQTTDDVMAATQQQMLYFFPLMTIFIGFRFASGLVLYWFIFSLFQTIQQYLVSGWGGLLPWLRRVNLVK